MEKVEYSVCEDCMLYVAYGESETLSTEESNWTAQRMRDEIDFRDAHFVNGIQPTEDDPEGAGFDEFSHSQCELCMDSRSGSRHGVTLIIQEKGDGA